MKTPSSDGRRLTDEQAAQQSSGRGFACLISTFLVLSECWSLSIELNWQNTTWQFGLVLFVPALVINAAAVIGFNRWLRRFNIDIRPWPASGIMAYTLIRITAAPVVLHAAYFIGLTVWWTIRA